MPDGGASLVVALGERTYPIHIRPELAGLGAAVAATLPRARRVAVVTNPVVGALYGAATQESLRAAGLEPVLLELPDGEAHKTVQTWAQLVEDLLDARIDRETPVLALGGGVTGDVVGFAAASVLRGVPLVQVPTTLLAMVDSSVGGKTAVNARRGKNLVGAFYQPALVYAPLETLQTLDAAEIRSGLGEVVKHGLLQDPALLELCEQQAAAILAREAGVLARLVAGCCRVKAAVVAQDERETGLRAILNLGHTVGHALEAVLGYGTMRHGECVALGLVAEARWAAQRGDCDAAVPARIVRALEGLGIAVSAPSWVTLMAMDAAAGADKKVVRGTLTTAILEDVGRVRLEQVPTTEIAAMMAQLVEC